MKIAKIIRKFGEHFVEVVRTDTVKFDDRPGWVFIREIDKIDRKKNVEWVHPDDVEFIWVRDFSF
jgi:hypothetical protein